MSGEPDLDRLTESTPDDEQGTFPFSLLLGVVLGAFASLIVAFLRRTPAVRREGTPALRLAPSLPATDAAATPSFPAPAGATQPAPGPGSPAIAPTGRSTRWPTPTKYVIGVILFLTVVAVIYVSRSVIPLTIFAALLAFVVHPIVEFFQRRLRLRKGLAVGLTYLLVLAALLTVALVLIPSIVGAVNSFLDIDYRAAIDQVQQMVQSLSARVAALPVLNAILLPILESIRNALASISSAEAPEPVAYTVPVTEVGVLLAKAVGGLGKILGPVFSALTSLVFMVLIGIYLSLSADQIRSWYPKLIPPGYEGEISSLFRRVGGIWASFLRSQVVLMTLIGTVVWLGNLILGNANALLLGVIAGFLELIPNIGPALALIPGVVMALLFGSSHFALSPWIFALIVVAFYLLVQFLENQFVVPHIMGDAVDLPPLVVILGTFVGGATVGLLGVFLATPVIATGREVFMYLYNKILEPPTASGPPEDHPSLLASIRRWVGGVKLPSDLRLFSRRSRQKPTAAEHRAHSKAKGSSQVHGPASTYDLGKKRAA